MARLVRKCQQCGTLDTTREWSSTDDAAKQGAFDENWTCKTCAWAEFDLVEADEEPART